MGKYRILDEILWGLKGYEEKKNESDFYIYVGIAFHYFVSVPH